MANNAVEKAILKATKIRRKKKEDEQDLLRRAVEQVNELPEEAFDDLPEAAQLWYNAAATAYEEDETIPGFDDPLDDPDEDEEEEDVEAEEEESEDDDADEDEEESEEEAEEEADDEDEEDEDEEEEEEEEPAPKKGRKGKAKAAPAAAKSKGKKGKAKAAEPEEDDEDEAEEEAKPKAKKKRSSGSPEGKPAVTGRIIELLVEALPKQPTQEAVTKTLRKEGYTVSDNTIGIQLSFVRRVLGHLQTMGKIKTK